MTYDAAAVPSTPFNLRSSRQSWMASQFGPERQASFDVGDQEDQTGVVDSGFKKASPEPSATLNGDQSHADHGGGDGRAGRGFRA